MGPWEAKMENKCPRGLQMETAKAEIVRGRFLGRQDGTKEWPGAPTSPSRRFLDELGVPERDPKWDRVEH